MSGRWDQSVFAPLVFLTSRPSDGRKSHIANRPSSRLGPANKPPDPKGVGGPLPRGFEPRGMRVVVPFLVFSGQIYGVRPLSPNCLYLKTSPLNLCRRRSVLFNVHLHLNEENYARRMWKIWPKFICRETSCCGRECVPFEFGARTQSTEIIVTRFEPTAIIYACVSNSTHTF